jgi:hypothetical protein
MKEFEVSMLPFRQFLIKAESIKEACHLSIEKWFMNETSATPLAQIAMLVREVVK